jgi:hypothetical protein
MRQLGKFSRPGRALAGVALLVSGVFAGGGLGCSLMLDTDVDPYRCHNDQDRARYPNAACDSIRKECVPRLPGLGGDSGSQPDAGGGNDAGGLACELSFDNDLRIPLGGADGGLRPLPDTP